MNASRTARERVRAELTREITDVARAQLATEGAGGLSLRAVAREMGMVSSAIYRYFPSRDDLLTALIVDGYNAIGEVAERADAACPAGEHARRWLAVCRAIRDWALAHPHEYALVYGSPVPGYQAPQQTIGPAARAATVFGKIISDAREAGALRPPGIAKHTILHPAAPGRHGAQTAQDAVQIRGLANNALGACLQQTQRFRLGHRNAPDGDSRRGVRQFQIVNPIQHDSHAESLVYDHHVGSP